MSLLGNLAPQRWTLFKGGKRLRAVVAALSEADTLGLSLHADEWRTNAPEPPPKLLSVTAGEAREILLAP